MSTGPRIIWFPIGPFDFAPVASNRTTRLALVSSASGFAVNFTAGIVTPAGSGFAAAVSNA